MILIAESGSTKTDWRLIKADKTVENFSTIGFNPFFINEEDIFNELMESDLAPIKNNIRQVYFYGAGCSSLKNSLVIEDAFVSFFIDAKVEVNHDLLAAARALCKHSAGMIGILGTGSNSCIYDGSKIVSNVPALGYVLGDEGSGANIGLTFIKAYLNNELPKPISAKFYEEYNLDLSEILDRIYKEPLPNRFLASLSPFVLNNCEDDFVLRMVKKCFEAFFDKHICKYEFYKDYDLHLIGSISFYYQNIIREIALTKGVKIGEIIKQPIDELLEFHS